MNLRVGLGTFSGQMTTGSSPEQAYRDVVDLAVLAEEQGFDSVWVSEHHSTKNAHIPSPLILLAAIAARTHRIRLGTGIAIGPFQLPLRFAEDCAVLDRLSDGRLSVGVGAGWRPEEFAAFGIPRSERGARTEELITICKKAWTGRAFSFHGVHNSLTDAVVTPTPSGELKVFMVGGTTKALDRVARLADGYFADGVPQAGLQALHRRIEHLEIATQEYGLRKPESIPICFAVNAWVSDRPIPEHVFQAMWTRISASKNWHSGKAEDDRLPIDIAEVKRRGWIGAAHAIVEQARQWVEPFASHELELIFRLRFPGISMNETVQQVRTVGSQVLPLLREMATGARSREERG